MLISTAELREHLQDPAWFVFDCRHDLFDFARGAQIYRAGHVPGAYFAPVESALSGAKTGSNGRHPLPEPDDFVAFLAQHGVGETSQVVAYDDVGGQYAARFWWMARWIGLPRAAVLDGGFAKWVADGHAVASDEPLPRVGGAVSARPDPSLVWNTATVMTRAEAGNCLVLDARAPERFRGESEPIDQVAGRIPGAANRFFKANLQADLTMRPAAELKREFAELLGDRRPADVVHQCGSGVTACVNLLAMEHAGLPGSKLYAGSWSEWIADPARPVAQG